MSSYRNGPHLTYDIGNTASDLALILTLTLTIYLTIVREFVTLRFKFVKISKFLKIFKIHKKIRCTFVWRLCR